MAKGSSSVAGKTGKAAKIAAYSEAPPKKKKPKGIMKMKGKGK